MSRTLRVDLKGAKLGEVSARDVANLIVLVEAAVARAAGRVIGRPLKKTGRWENVVQRSVDFRLVGVRAGSVVLELELPPDPVIEDVLELDDPRLGEVAIARMLDVASGEANDPEVAHPLLQLSTTVGVGARYQSVEFRHKRGKERMRRVRLDQAGLDRIATAVKMPPLASTDEVLGVLYEADFERMTAHVRTLDRKKVEVTFTEDQADDIHLALRQQARLLGEVTFDRDRRHATRITIREITRADQLAFALGVDAAWAATSVDELLRDAQPVNSFEDLRGEAIPDAEFAEMVAFLQQ